MRYYFEKLPNKCNTSLLTAPKKKFIELIISLEGIIELGKTKYLRKYNCGKICVHTLNDNIKIMEDFSTITLNTCYNIPFIHYKININQEIYKIENIELVISYYNNKIYDYYFIANNFNEINELRYKLGLLFQ